jgi:hypothetical protein
VLLLALGPRALLAWPWFWLVPVGGYLLVVALTPRLRRTLTWAKPGRVGWASGAATLALMVLTSGVLVLYQLLAHPDVSELGSRFPFGLLGGVVLAGLIFAVVNATFEEVVFRGILFDALEAQWNQGMALVVTALIFGLGHRTGYPPGPAGIALAALYGLLLGLLRVWVGGLALPILAHITADATIYALLVHAGAISCTP